MVTKHTAYSKRPYSNSNTFPLDFPVVPVMSLRRVYMHKYKYTTPIPSL